jgi:hypothetical protein
LEIGFIIAGGNRSQMVLVPWHCRWASRQRCHGRQSVSIAKGNGLVVNCADDPARAAASVAGSI